MKRTLSLKRETIAELADEQLADVAGGQQAVTGLACLSGFVCQLTEQPRCF